MRRRGPPPSRVCTVSLRDALPIWIDGAEVEPSRDLDELFRIGESFEVDAGDLADGAVAAVATDHVAGVEPLDSGWRGNLDIDAVSLRCDAAEYANAADFEVRFAAS